MLPRTLTTCTSCNLNGNRVSLQDTRFFKIIVSFSEELYYNSSRNTAYLRTSGNEKEYFEIKMTNNELTNDYVLEIVDFADADETADLRELWDTQVDTLRRTCGF